MINKIPYTSYSGQAGALCSKGNAVEFLQPWYTPISTTPANTGMAVGGVGSTFTLTPQGNTPNFSFIPGIFVDCEYENIHFNDFYFSVMDEYSLDNIDIPSVDELLLFLKFYPADLSFVISSLDNKETILSGIKNCLRSGLFYKNNKYNFERWNIEFSDKTQKAIVNNPSGLETQLLVAIDFFNGLLVNNSARALSLTANNGSSVESIDSSNIEYRALYPIAEYEYQGLESVALTRQVISPIVKNDQMLCSLPMHWNHFEMSNRSDKTQLVTLVQPLRNLIGSTYKKAREGVQDSCCHLVQNAISQQHQPVTISGAGFEFHGVSMTSNSPYDGDISGEVLYGVHTQFEGAAAEQVTVTVKPQVYCSKADQQVERALKTGRTNAHFDRGIYSGRELLSALVCVQVTLKPGETIALRFAQVMDHSKILLDGWESEKAYARYFDAQSRAQSILNQTLPRLSEIEQNIISQQREFLDNASQTFVDNDSALRFATMAMNSLSFLAESTVWDKENVLLVKECVDYPFFNSLDVYFYGSFSLLYLLPELDGYVMKHFAKAILASNVKLRRYWEYEDKPYAELVDEKYQGTRAERGAVIHDLGSPFDIEPDAYSWHNVKEWKDLAPKFILMVYRHWQKTGDRDVVDNCWFAVKESIDYLTNLIEDRDTLPLTRGTDDTFDNLASHGVSIYCGSLWVAGLRAASELALLVGEEELAQGYTQRSKEALETLERGLWDEQKGYYHFFITPVQAKHLTGNGFESLEKLGLTLTGNTVQDASLVNAYLDAYNVESSISKRDQRLAKKQRLIELAPQAFSAEFAKLEADSDNSFGDALLADSYLKLVDLPGLFDSSRIERTLDFIYQTNFITNSPKLGVANMTLVDGRPHDAFQAQDVWIGVQFSVATALRLAGKQVQAERLMDAVYQALYSMAKIPFAAPEGFNCSVTVSDNDIAQRFDLASEVASELLLHLQKVGHLFADGRVNPELTQNIEEFALSLSNLPSNVDYRELHTWLLSTGLKYTAGRYFRPGMIYAYLYR
ncbi:GH116 family glycosyl hydrolase [Vibrio parahaemolyticus]|uniref:GH116 family glycosyl hydrolase n=1 Tax=Vibrio parahaemolyticus TaxID=670 RepID=UPI0011102407|nr:GH116 family glycosyl hydrolase [Vibrio parahaemolyticus]TMX34524.1 glucosylceramidase [Vibrio parahaemolyticus]TMX71354.1 glucosylceramidase [Vibrio parahaemolyticus]